MGKRLGGVLDPLQHGAQLSRAVAHGDDEGGVDEEEQLADLDHLFGVYVASGLDDDQQGLAVELDLGSLVSVDRALHRKLVQVELAGDRLELLRRGLEEAEPDEGICALGGFADVLEGKVPVTALPFFVDRAVDDHVSKYPPARPREALAISVQAIFTRSSCRGQDSSCALDGVGRMIDSCSPSP